MCRMLQRFVLLTGAGLVLCLGGCSDGRVRLPETGATLEGTVTYGKERVMIAMVIAAGRDGGAQGFIEEDGRYKIENVPLGEVTLAVNVGAGKGQMMSRKMAGQLLPKVIDVPAKYADPSTSGIKTTINKGANTFDIVIPK